MDVPVDMMYFHCIYTQCNGNVQMQIMEAISSASHEQLIKCQNNAYYIAIKKVDRLESEIKGIQ
jgi:hypothetical protein